MLGASKDSGAAVPCEAKAITTSARTDHYRLDDFAYLLYDDLSYHSNELLPTYHHIADRATTVKELYAREC